MYGYNDYFLTEQETTGYSSGAEALYDAYRLFDMILENLLDIRAGESDEGLVFSRGIKMTEKEAESYYFAKPADRISPLFRPEFAGEIEKAREYIKSREAHTEAGIRLPLKELREEFSLSFFEELCVLTALAIHIDLKYTRLFGYLENEPNLQYPTAGLCQMLYETVKQGDALFLSHRLLAPESVMHRFFLDGEQVSYSTHPFLHIPLVLNHEILDYIMNEAYGSTFSSLYLEVCSMEDPKTPVIFESELTRILSQAGETSVFDYIAIDSKDIPDAKYLLTCAAGKLGTDLYVLDIRNVLSSRELSTEKLKKKLQREFIRMRLKKGLLFILAGDDSIQFEILRDMAEAYLLPQSIYVVRDGKKGRAEDFSSVLSLPELNMGARLMVWQYSVNQEQAALEVDVSLPDLADCYKLTASQIRGIAREAGYISRTEQRTITKEELLAIINRDARERIGSLATHIPVRYTWEDLEIEETERKRLHLACDRFRMRNRIDDKYGLMKKNAYGNGVSILLYGPPGTGKTMTAQVVAREVSLPLYRIDVSQIFSKYVGETQKNLSTIFDEAAKTNVILFFDEADALFSKRTEIKDSNDRYANAETAFLLQKVEEYSGMTILATNLFQNFDRAYVRRITYTIKLDNPDATVRRRLWESVLPKEIRFAPDVDLDFLAETFELSGSNIRSILNNAAYMSLANGEQITAYAITNVMRYEFEKLGRIVDPAEFGKYAIYLY